MRRVPAVQAAAFPLLSVCKKRKAPKRAFLFLILSQGIALSKNTICSIIILLLKECAVFRKPFWIGLFQQRNDVRFLLL